MFCSGLWQASFRAARQLLASSPYSTQTCMIVHSLWSNSTTVWLGWKMVIHTVWVILQAIDWWQEYCIIFTVLYHTVHSLLPVFQEGIHSHRKMHHREWNLEGCDRGNFLKQFSSPACVSRYRDPSLTSAICISHAVVSYQNTFHIPAPTHMRILQSNSQARFFMRKIHVRQGVQILLNHLKKQIPKSWHKIALLMFFWTSNQIEILQSSSPFFN